MADGALSVVRSKIGPHLPCKVNNTAPRTDPWETPKSKIHESDNVFPILTECN